MMRSDGFDSCIGVLRIGVCEIPSIRQLSMIGADLQGRQYRFYGVKRPFTEREHLSEEVTDVLAACQIPSVPRKICEKRSKCLNH